MATGSCLPQEETSVSLSSSPIKALLPDMGPRTSIRRHSEGVYIYGPWGCRWGWGVNRGGGGGLGDTGGEDCGSTNIRAVCLNVTRRDQMMQVKRPWRAEKDGSRVTSLGQANIVRWVDKYRYHLSSPIYRQKDEQQNGMSSRGDWACKRSRATYQKE